jgi:hypothetical protein
MPKIIPKRYFYKLYRMKIILLKTFVTTVALLILNVKNGTKSATAVNYIST